MKNKENNTPLYNYCCSPSPKKILFKSAPFLSPVGTRGKGKIYPVGLRGKACRKTRQSFVGWNDQGKFSSGGLL